MQELGIGGRLSRGAGKGEGSRVPVYHRSEPDFPPPRRILISSDIHQVHLDIIRRLAGHLEINGIIVPGGLERRAHPLPPRRIRRTPRDHVALKLEGAPIGPIHEPVVRRHGVVGPGAGVERLVEVVPDGAVAVGGGRHLQVRVEGIVAAAGVGAARRDEEVVALTCGASPDPGRDGAAFEATVLDDGSTGVAGG